MNRELPSLEDIIDRLTILLDIVDRLIQDIVLLRSAGSKRQVPLQVGPSQELHTSIFNVSIINGQPHGDGLGRRQGPVTCILMPRHLLPIPRHFAEKMGAPANDILSQQILNTGHNFGRFEQVIDSPILHVRRTDRITVLARSQRSSENVVEINAKRGCLFIRKKINGPNKAEAIKILDLP